MGIIPPNLRPEFDGLRTDFSVEVLRNIVKDGWSVLNLTAGMADAFSDQAGILSLGGATYDGVGKYLHNPAVNTNQIPVMTSNVSNGTLSANSEYSATYSALKAADNNPGTFWHTSGTGASSWDYDIGAAAVVNTYSITPQDGFVYSWQFQAWSGSAWVTLDTRANVSFTAGVKQTFSCVNATSYNRYRVNFTSVGGDGYTRIVSFEFMTIFAVPNVDVRSISFTTGTITTLRLVALWEPVDASVLGTHCVMYAQHPSMGLYTIPLTDLGKYDATTRVIGGVVSMAQCASIKWGWGTTGNKCQRLHGVWAQWR